MWAAWLTAVMGVMEHIGPLGGGDQVAEILGGRFQDRPHGAGHALGIVKIIVGLERTDIPLVLDQVFVYSSPACSQMP